VKSAVETLSPTRVRLKVEVPFEELKPSLDTAYREIAKQVTIPGFRKGKIPPPIIDRRIGREFVLQQAVNDAIPRLYVSAIQENKVEPVGQPSLELPDEIVDGADLSFTAEVDVRPEITLPEYRGLEVKVEDADVSDEEVAERLEALRERFGSLTTVERAAGENDHVTINLSASKDGVELEDERTAGVTYKIGSGAALEGLDDALRGMQAGESKTFRSKLVSGQHAGEEVDVTVTVESVKEQQLPELDDEFAQLASEFDTLDELRADLRTRLERTKRLQQIPEARNQVIEKLLGQMDIPLPENAVAETIRARREFMSRQLDQIGLSWEQYLQSEGQTEEEFAAELERDVRENMKAEFVLDKIADAEELTVSEPELQYAIAQRAYQAGMDPNEFMRQIVENNQVPALVREVRRQKAVSTLVENAVVTDASGRTVDVRRIQPDGSLAPEGETDSTEQAASDAESGQEGS